MKAVRPNSGLRAEPRERTIFRQVRTCRRRYSRGTANAHKGSFIQSGTMHSIARIPDSRYTQPITRRPNRTTVVFLPTALSSSISR